MAYVDFLTAVHTQTKRDYVGRVNEFPKARAATIAKRYGRAYWDGKRTTGYGGYTYDGRWRGVAEKIAAYYELKPENKILDVGCGKGFLLYEFTQIIPGITVAGVDISKYAISHAKPEIQSFLQLGNAAHLPYPNKTFDLVVSLNTLHNLYCYDLDTALREIERVGKRKYICVESYRNEKEKANLLYWQLTCEAFNTPTEWEWWFKHTGYTGDYGFIFFT